MAQDGGQGTGLRDLDFAGFAQEFLRRNPAYVHEYHKVMRTRTAPDAHIVMEEMAHPWGLSFSLSTAGLR
ncbi:transcriptional regulator domain-containing protein [Novosphingobium sp. PY1]|uniref:transcriptional regulator domain-containing protein n=1 Tax=Novosphingobium sp. PY1 TaxID=1882221 RepID=UPI001AA80930|nr:DUF6499 domain-containing protein [Novosphingobium sp. PY1]GFM28645.1 uncharacterized protein PY1_contig-05-39 [Novosphingobium sp. PY1]